MKKLKKRDGHKPPKRERIPPVEETIMGALAHMVRMIDPRTRREAEGGDSAKTRGRKAYARLSIGFPIDDPYTD